MTVRLSSPISSGSAAGSSGSATSNGNSETSLVGRVIGIYVKYNDACPVTTTVTVRTVGTSPSAPTYDILKLSAANTDGWFYPVMQCYDTAGMLLVGAYKDVVVSDTVNILIENANAGDSADVYLMLEY